MSRETEKYLKKCRKIFPFVGKREREFLDKFKDSVATVSNDKDNIDYQELVQQLGEPKEIMLSYIQDCDNDYIVNKMNLRRMTRNYYILISLILIIVLSMICYFEYQTIQESKKQNIITEEVILEQN
ncbi:DUF6120 family protein [Longibaculum muris]|uniref:DUF6120 family protein n=1 Tax=Longibaculum muris TaxID=1796628 RepID=UPI0022E00A13|nr:DUF6120 family protein [Longibaculum muris]